MILKTPKPISAEAEIASNTFLFPASDWSGPFVVACDIRPHIPHCSRHARLYWSLFHKNSICLGPYSAVLHFLWERRSGKWHPNGRLSDSDEFAANACFSVFSSSVCRSFLARVHILQTFQIYCIQNILP